MKITTHSFTNIKIAISSIYIMVAAAPLLILENIYIASIFSIALIFLTYIHSKRVLEEVKAPKETIIDRESWTAPFNEFINKINHKTVWLRAVLFVSLNTIFAIIFELNIIRMIFITTGFVLPAIIVSYLILLYKYLEPLHREIYIGKPKGGNIDLKILNRLEREMLYDIIKIKQKRSKFILATIGDYLPKVVHHLLCIVFLLISGFLASQFETGSSLVITLSMFGSMVCIVYIFIYLSNMCDELFEISKFNTDIKELKVMRRLFIEERDSIEKS